MSPDHVTACPIPAVASKNNILDRPLVGSLLKAKYFPFVIQVLSLIIFGAMIIAGMNVYQNESHNTRYLAETNWVTFVCWVLWWPTIIFLSVFLGRVWCAVCPLELVSSLLNRIGFGWKFPWRKNGDILVTVTFVLVTIVGVAGFQMNMVPRLTAIYLLALLALVFIMGLLFTQRAFCNYVCPVSHLLGIHAWCAPLEWRVRDSGVCAACKNKPCITKRNQIHFFARSCTSKLYPPRIADNQSCLLCTQCSKSCDKDNLSLRFRSFFKDIFTVRKVSPALTLFSIVVSGFVLYELAAIWAPTQRILLYLPDAILENLNVTNPWVIAVTRCSLISLLFPTIFWLFPAMLNRLLRPASSIAHYLRVIAVSFFPILAGVHLIIALEDAVPRLKYLPLVLNDPQGMHTASLLLSRTLKLSNRMPPFLDQTVNLLQLLFIGVTLGVSVAAAYKISKRDSGISPTASILAVACYGSIFLAIVLFWKFI